MRRTFFPAVKCGLIDFSGNAGLQDVPWNLKAILFRVKYERLSACVDELVVSSFLFQA